ncbi:MULTISPECIES: peptidoglycan DD-metalloendopeptidase family protein [unclassified Pseudoxanthomonas]|uniref:peptidoglycan DD-metalloendopeptidase family protein n=1 Tax=unclassified Pseudoxanthomonas TaxID=2645906 RepID=UPI0030779BB2
MSRTLHPSSPVPSLLAACVLLLLSGQAAAIDPSKGVYRIPYVDSTEVKVTNDHIKHSPPGRIDMSGKSGGPYKIVAAADGTIRHVVDGFSERIDCKANPDKPQNNNYVWIEHANGEWTKYTHMKKSSSTGKAKLKVGQFVSAGTYLGDEGDVGCASGDHLHFEVGVPKASGGIATTGGFLTDNDGSKRNRIPRICGIDKGMFVSGENYTARKVPGAIKPGAKEVARHGVPARDYQCLFDQAVNAGYALEWIDGFDVDGKVYYNAVFRPNANMAWKAFHGLTGAQYQQRFDELTGKGYRPYQVESYLDQGNVRYAVIYRKQSGPTFSAYHGLSANEHQQRMDELTKAGYRPRNVSVVSSGGQRRYTALYEKTDIGSWQAKSQLTAGEYQQAFNANAEQGRQIVYVNGYMHGGQPYFTAIWSSKSGGTYKAKHGLTSSQYQSEWQSNTGAGLLTRDVTGYSSGGSARYAAIWRK